MNIFNYIVENKGDCGYKPKPASKSTESPPGTAGKVRELASRLEAGEDMWHPMDATDFTNPSTHLSCLFNERSERLSIIREISNGKRR
jgi:hypothetical protein